ncbi:ORF6N domain-containing protein [Paenibacillus cymbidii]|uniref:ORF6N domain-containing protein n=1 Tax=Paenibacillus cymbidii TaxID=1639034 RepID=UPI001080ED78|nr:ORF6N domain-containing protein [Paenibacillus cymbidii]
MSLLTPIEFNDHRVLTTVQLAEIYGTEVQILTNNFNRNKNRYDEGKHYIALQGEEKRNFLNLHQNDLGSKNASILYLWTEKGAWMHAKSLNTDAAWSAYEMLVDDYYRVKAVSVPRIQRLFDSLPT